MAAKIAHTLIWAFYAGCIVAIPPLAWRGGCAYAVLLTAVASFEVLVVLLNAGRCPLTAIAARCTDHRRGNFYSYLPKWLARYKKSIFGTLYAGGALASALLWNTRNN